VKEHRVLDAGEVARAHLVAGLGGEHGGVLEGVERHRGAGLRDAALEEADRADVAAVDDLVVVALDQIEVEVARLEEREAPADDAQQP